MTVSEKVRMAAKLVELGVDILEAGFPIASQGDSDAVAAVAKEYPWVIVAALARANRLDIMAAVKSLQHARRPRIHTFLATSDIHLKYKLKKSREQVLEDAVAAVRLAREYCEDVEFSAEDATRTDPDYLEQVCRAVVAAGARTVNLPDTVGYSVIPAPTTDVPTLSVSAAILLPQVPSPLDSYYALHEMIGLAWYRFRYRNG